MEPDPAIVSIWGLEEVCHKTGLTWSIVVGLKVEICEAAAVYLRHDEMRTAKEEFANEKTEIVAI